MRCGLRVAGDDGTRYAGSQRRAAAPLCPRWPRRGRFRCEHGLPEGHARDVLARAVASRLLQPLRRDLPGPAHSQGADALAPRAVAEPRITWTFWGEDLTLDDYLARNPTTGLLIARGDTIFVERYQYGRTDRHRFTSFSMAKTMTAMLMGIAIDERRIRSVDDLAAVYVPALAGTEYGRTSLRHLLQMSSGVRFNENFRPGFTPDDVLQLILDTYARLGPGGVGAVTSFNDREHPAGTKFSYASVETQVLGLVLARAIGRPVAEYLEQKIWQPIGAEADATWLVDNSGQEATYCCVNAVLRDYARLGLLLAHDGNWRGRQIIPAAWVVNATTAHLDQPHLWPGTATDTEGYGYQTWILPGERRMFMLMGGNGQRIYVDPRSTLVMVNTGVSRLGLRYPQRQEMDALWSALVRQLGSDHP